MKHYIPAMQHFHGSFQYIYTICFPYYILLQHQISYDVNAQFMYQFIYFTVIN